MKILFTLLILPLLSFGQTVHVKDENVVYEGKEKIAEVSASEIYNRIQKCLPSIIDNYRIEKQSANAFKARGVLRLKTPFNIIRTVPYSIELRPIENGYEYRIDSVSFTEQKRGEKVTIRSSKEVLGNMGEADPVEETERILNETDMRFQKLLDLLKSGIKKG